MCFYQCLGLLKRKGQHTVVSYLDWKRMAVEALTAWELFKIGATVAAGTVVGNGALCYKQHKHEQKMQDDKHQHEEKERLSKEKFEREMTDKKIESDQSVAKLKIEHVKIEKEYEKAMLDKKIKSNEFVARQSLERVKLEKEYDKELLDRRLKHDQNMAEIKRQTDKEELERINAQIELEKLKRENSKAEAEANKPKTNTKRQQKKRDKQTALLLETFVKVRSPTTSPEEILEGMKKILNFDESGDEEDNTQYHIRRGDNAVESM